MLAELRHCDSNHFTATVASQRGLLYFSATSDDLNYCTWHFRAPESFVRERFEFPEAAIDYNFHWMGARTAQDRGGHAGDVALHVLMRDLAEYFNV